MSADFDDAAVAARETARAEFNDRVKYLTESRDEWRTIALGAIDKVNRVQALADEWERLSLPGMTDWDYAFQLRNTLDGEPVD
jgi:hypothetical protein